MKFTDGIKMAFSDIRRRKLRSFLTIVAISVGSLLLMAMLGLGDTLAKQVENMFSTFSDTQEITVFNIKPSAAGSVSINVGVQDKNAAGQKRETKNITTEDLDKISKISGVEYVKAILETKLTGVTIEGNSVQNKGVTLRGYNFSYYKSFKNDLAYGNDFSNDKNEIIVGQKYLKAIGIDNGEDVLGKEITLKVDAPVIDGVAVRQSFATKGKIIGVLKESSDEKRNIICSQQIAEEVLNYYSEKTDYFKETGYPSLVVRAKTLDDVKTINDEVRNKVGFETFTMAELSQKMAAATKSFKLIFSVAGIIVILVASIGLINTMNMSIQEKKKTIGIMKAVGASRRAIKNIFLVQAALLGILGAILGCAIAAIITVVLNTYVLKETQVVLSLVNLGICFGITFVISTISGLMPASKASKMNVVEIISYE
ncbi:ABC transporter permease [Clostridium sp. 'White wine YQ']|uniref:ABC transporter permease n=1 Tax=Clostridium sp. 'White wine YQ' TaxID=3027474 RepID=UPI0023669818|nr:FtsX-like permease family protein [Clostridium sp. 'White wine YQ']MDD7794919.1 ABC transporter permease [Clostridium sp. 'White wine YQ']